MYPKGKFTSVDHFKTSSKISEIKKRHPELLVQVDGGMTLENLPELVKAGADIFVAGSFIFGSSDPRKTISEMKEVISKK